LDKAGIVLLQPGLQGLVPLPRIGRGHRARIDADYRAVYAANLLGLAGGLLAGFGGAGIRTLAGDSLARFGSLESGLISNIGRPMPT
jgi:hypothetical protein